MRGDVYLLGVGSRSKRSSALLVAFGLLGSLSAACGGSEASAGPPTQSAHDAARTNPTRHDTAPSDEASSEPAPEEAPKAGPCDDGTCSSCGDGLCPNGWYCDESAAGGPACGWLPQCAQKASCGCLTGKLGASCKCSEQAGGLHVTCQ